MSNLLILHRYFIWANRMGEYFHKALEKSVRQEGQVTNAEKATKYFADDPGMFMSYWYGALYAVIEEWEKSNLHDPEIDRLLDSPNVELLKRYRNGAFHFQKDYFDDKFFNFIAKEGTATWVEELNEKLNEYFLREIRCITNSKNAK